MAIMRRDVRFTPESGHSLRVEIAKILLRIGRGITHNQRGPGGLFFRFAIALLNKLR
jgi:hypothetical protein